MPRSFEGGVVRFERRSYRFAREAAVPIDEGCKRLTVVTPDHLAQLHCDLQLFLDGPAFEEHGMGAPNAVFGRGLGLVWEAEPIALGQQRGVADRVAEEHLRCGVGRGARMRDGDDLDLYPVRARQARCGLR